MPEWIYQGLEEMEFITYTHILSRVIYVVLIFTLIKEENDYILYPIFNVVGLSLASIASSSSARIVITAATTTDTAATQILGRTIIIATHHMMMAEYIG